MGTVAFPACASLDSNTEARSAIEGCGIQHELVMGDITMSRETYRWRSRLAKLGVGFNFTDRGPQVPQQTAATSAPGARGQEPPTSPRRHCEAREALGDHAVIPYEIESNFSGTQFRSECFLLNSREKKDGLKPFHSVEVDDWSSGRVYSTSCSRRRSQACCPFGVLEVRGHAILAKNRSPSAVPCWHV
ncbi:hypothetical protein MRX96_027835 [Rhipicephalus microplus]